MDINECCVHINSEEEAQRVFDYYALCENGGFTHTTVGRHNCMRFPYLMSGKDGNFVDIFGCMHDHGRKCYEFKDWLVEIDAIHNMESANEREIVEFLGF